MEIFQGSELKAVFPLSIDRVYTLEDDGASWTVEIKDGAAHISESACSGQDCVHFPPVSKAGQSILCAPQQLLLVIRAESAPDAVVK